jgi:iron(III) transport system permease protein
LVLVPLLVPSVMLAIAWIQLFGPNAGWINILIRSVTGGETGPLDIFTFPGLIACQAAVLVPFVFLLLSAALRAMNPALEEASSVAGARPFVTFVRITCAVLRPGLLAPLLLATLVALEQFDIPLTIGVPARVDVFSTRIFYELNPDSGLPIYGRAAAVALPLLGIGAVLLALYNRLVRQADSFVTMTSRGYRRLRYPLRRWRWPAVVFAWSYVGGSSVLPVAALVGTSLFGNVPLSAAALEHVTLDAYRRVVTDPVFVSAVGNTLVVATLSATLVTTIGLLLSWILVRTRLRGRSVVDLLSIVSIGIPSVIAALATMILYLTVPIPVYGTVWILVLAYSYRLAVSTRVSRAGLVHISRELEEASAIAGARWGATLRRIVVPLLTPSLTASFLLLFIVGVREFTLPMILGSRDSTVLGVMLWRQFEDGHAAEAAAIATMLFALVMPVAFLARRTGS